MTIKLHDFMKFLKNFKMNKKTTTNKQRKEITTHS